MTILDLGQSETTSRDMPQISYFWKFEVVGVSQNLELAGQHCYTLDLTLLQSCSLER